jgi:hypothetical protein
VLDCVPLGMAGHGGTPGRGEKRTRNTNRCFG